MNRQEATAKYLDPPFDSAHKWHLGKAPASIAMESGEILQRSWNLAGLRRYAGKNITNHVHVKELPECRAVLTVRFADGSWSQQLFESDVVLALTLREWRNLYGVPLFWLDIRNQTQKGEVEYSDKILKRKVGV